MTYGNLGGKPVNRHGSGGNGARDEGQAMQFLGTVGMTPASPLETMVTVMARALADGETAVFGAVSLLPLAACRLAQLTHAPNLTVLAGASGGVNPEAQPLLPSSGDYGNLVAEAVLPFDELLLLQAGGRYDVFFAGGLQIDQYGNANLVGTPAVRGPGAAGLPLAGRVGRTILYSSNHDRRLFVPRVDHVTLGGWEGLKKNRGAPVLVVTPLAVLDFVPASDGGRRMRLVSVHGGATVEQVRDATGFELIMPDGDVPQTPLPDKQTLKMIREFDSGALLLEGIA